MGLRYEAPLPLLLEDLPPVGQAIDREKIVALALDRRGELVQAASAAQVAELEVCAQNTGCLLPFKKTFAAASDIHSRPIPQGTSNGVFRPEAVGIDMPTLLVGHKSDRVERAQDFSNRAAAVVEKTHNLIALEAEDAYHKWQASAAQVKTVEQSVSKAAKLQDLLGQRWQDSKVTTEDYLRAVGLHDQARSQLFETLYHHALALAALERVTAGGYVPSYRRAALPH
jgi:outer membrane protein TolC